MENRTGKWVTLAALSALLFLVSASVFGSLGVVLPYMVKDQGWSWSQAGLGYALMGGACGASSWLPAMMVRRFGVRSTFGLGALIIAGGFLCWALTRSVALYVLGAILAGGGYQFLSMIPGTHVLSRLFEKRGLPFGIYFTSAGLGGAAGPMMVLAVLQGWPGDWRLYWAIQMVVTLVAGGLCLLAIREGEAPSPAAATPVRAAVGAGAGEAAEDVWTVRDALRTPQFYVVLAAYFTHLIVGATVGSLSVSYMTELGFSIVLASGLHSLESLLATAGRFIAGVAADYLHQRYIMVIGLGLLAVGSMALTSISSYPMMLVYATGAGLGYGFVVLAAPMTLLRFYGRRANMELYALVAMSGVLAAAGPFAAGVLRDRTGQFTGSFHILTVVSLVVMAAAILMRPPRRSTERVRAPEPAKELFSEQA